MSFLYISTDAHGKPVAFTPKVAKAGTDTATKRPMTLESTGTVIRYGLSPDAIARFHAETDADKRAAILAEGKATESTSGRVTVTTAALDAFRAAIRATFTPLDEKATSAEKLARVDALGEAAAAVWRSGVVALDSDTDDTDAAARALFAGDL